jgi:hypothetical protein
MSCNGYENYKAIAKNHRDQARYLRFNGTFYGKRKTQQFIAEKTARLLTLRKWRRDTVKTAQSVTSQQLTLGIERRRAKVFSL